MSARLLYARFPAAGHRICVEWQRVVAELVDGDSGGRAFHACQEPLTASAPAVAWRLVSENRREIARGCRVRGDETGARSDIEALLRAVDVLEIHIASAPRTRGAGWFVSVGDRLVMIGARRYEKTSAARSAAALAVRLTRQLEAQMSTGGSRGVVSDAGARGFV